MATRGRTLSKQQEVELLHERFSNATAGFVVDFRGLTVEQISVLRSRLREKDAELRVVKNTMARIASKGTSFAAVARFFQGPTAVAIPRNGPVGPASVLIDYAKENAKLGIKAGLLGSTVLDSDGIKALASLPSQAVLRATMLRTLAAVPSSFLRLLKAVPENFAQVLRARQEALEPSAE
ncbi:MAG: 50S ribosomal protein L10 [Candidatus Schekmanbacteria bacterium]|nr:50S ribosomal protein L10 [Candidatus Schekmanbacteria bacterium]